MRTLSIPITAVAVLLASVACGGDDGPSAPPSQNTRTLTTLEVSPQTASLFTLPPGNSVKLTVTAKDQNGSVMTGGTPTFASNAAGVAQVAPDGTITAAGQGTAQITTSLTMGSVTRTSSTTVTVDVAGASASVTAPGFAFQPATVNIRSGGTVTWGVADIPHNVRFQVANAPEDVPTLQNAADSRTFPSSGSFNYICGIHPSMTGVVHVH